MLEGVLLGFYLKDCRGL